MNYFPVIESAEPRRRFPLGKYTAVLLDNIKSAGGVQYRYILVVFNDESEKPCFFVASEVNTMVEAFGGGSHFLGVFPGNGHENHGDSDDWADLKKFTERALEIVKERLKIAG
jgi:hypothetical protein